MRRVDSIAGQCLEESFAMMKVIVKSYRDAKLRPALLSIGGQMSIFVTMVLLLMSHRVSAELINLHNNVT
jgi:hypothetical protein